MGGLKSVHSKREVSPQGKKGSGLILFLKKLGFDLYIILYVIIINIQFRTGFKQTNKQKSNPVY